MIIAAHQELTRQWWQDRAGGFELVISELVYEEARRGDGSAAAARVEVLDRLAILLTNDEAITLAEHLVSEGPLPPESAADALHIAIAAVNGIDFLLTWNCKHLANASHRHRVEVLVESAGYACPVICTPEELMEE